MAPTTEPSFAEKFLQRRLEELSTRLMESERSRRDWKALAHLAIVIGTLGWLAAFLW